MINQILFRVCFYEICIMHSNCWLEAIVILIVMGRLKLLHFGFSAPELFITSRVSLRSTGEGFENSLRNIASHEGMAYLVSPQVGQLWKVLVMLKKSHLVQNKWNNYKNLKNSSFNAYLNFEVKDYSTEEVDIWEECVGYPGIKLLMTRSEKVKVKYQTQRKFEEVQEEVKGFAAKVMQQAHDHLEAIDPLSKAKDIQLLNEELRRQHGAVIKQLFAKFIREREQRNATISSQLQNAYRRSRQFNELRRQILYCVTDFYRK